MSEPPSEACANKNVNDTDLALTQEETHLCIVCTMMDFRNIGSIIVKLNYGTTIRKVSWSDSRIIIFLFIFGPCMADPSKYAHMSRANLLSKVR